MSDETPLNFSPPRRATPRPFQQCRTCAYWMLNGGAGNCLLHPPMGQVPHNPQTPRTMPSFGCFSGDPVAEGATPGRPVLPPDFPAI